MQNTEIIEKLNVEQKLAIASDVRTLKTLSETLGLPCVGLMKIDKLQSGNERTFPKYSAMANTWNSELMKKTFAAQASEAQSMGFNVLLASNAGVKNSPLSKGVSEDPVLCGELMDSFAKGVKSKKAFACVGSNLEDIDVYYMDEQFDERAFNEYYMAAFASAKAASSFVFPYKRLQGKYASLNTEKVGTFLQKKAKNKGFTLCNHCADDLTIRALAEGNILLGANSEPLRNGLEKFFTLQKRVENGELDGSAIDGALGNYTALSPALLDEAVDRAISFALSAGNVAEGTGQNRADLETAQLAAEECIVLLKNKGVLPLQNVKRLAVVTSEEKKSFAEQLCEKISKKVTQCKAQCVEGYALAKEGESSRLQWAMQLAKTSDVTLVIAESKKGAYRLTASQLALVDELESAGCKTVVLLCGEESVDLAFDEQVNAMLVCPSITQYSAEALANILTGNTSPSGRLANTYYEGTETHFAQLVKNKRQGYNKVGQFVGYRNYDGRYLHVKYPFGHGLSYSKFEYSGLYVSGNKISFTVRNLGYQAASEVIQVYVGKRNSTIVRPFKELKSFYKVRLGSGESKVIQCEIDAASLRVFSKGKQVSEGGAYEIYIGSSIKDIRLRSSMSIVGERVPSNGERYSDYMQTFSNVLSGGYTMSEVRKKTVAGKKTRTAGGCIAAVALLAAIIFGLLHLAGGIDVGETPYFQILAICLPLLFVLGGGTSAIGVIISKKSANKEAILSTGKAHEGQEKQARQSYRKLFDSLYEEKDEQEEKTEHAEQVHVTQEEFVGAFDSKRTFQTVCEDLAKYLTEHGILADYAMARKILSGVCSSRILQIVSKEKALSRRLVALLGQFFGGSVENYDIADAQSFADILYAKDGSNTAISELLQHCSENRDAIHLLAADYTDIDGAAKVFTQLSRYADSRIKNELSVYYDGKTQKVLLYPNLWIALCAEEGEKILSTNATFNEALCTLYLQLDACAEKEGATLEKPFNYYQLYKMEKTALRFDGTYAQKNLPDEDKFWKKVDKIERYLSEETGYRFSSKLSASIERFATVFLACDGELEGALDSAVACKLVLTALGLAGLSEREFAVQIESIFGEDSTEETKKMIGGCGTVVAE